MQLGQLDPTTLATPLLFSGDEGRGSDTLTPTVEPRRARPADDDVATPRIHDAKVNQRATPPPLATEYGAMSRHEHNLD
jgi:hypothetical protein